MKVWVTKYALTEGVYEVEVRKTQSPSYVAGKGPRDNYHGEGRQWHRTEAGALAKAEQMRLAKIKSLQKSISRLEQLEFE